MIMEHLTVSEVGELLKKEGFPGDVVQLFADNAVDGEALMMLETDENMKELGLKKVGDRLKIKKLISKYRGGDILPPADREKESVRIVRTIMM